MCRWSHGEERLRGGRLQGQIRQGERVRRVLGEGRSSQGPLAELGVVQGKAPEGVRGRCHVRHARRGHSSHPRHGPLAREPPRLHAGRRGRQPHALLHPGRPLAPRPALDEDDDRYVLAACPLGARVHPRAEGHRRSRHQPGACRRPAREHRLVLLGVFDLGRRPVHLLGPQPLGRRRPDPLQGADGRHPAVPSRGAPAEIHAHGAFRALARLGRQLVVQHHLRRGRDHRGSLLPGFCACAKYRRLVAVRLFGGHLGVLDVLADEGGLGFGAGADLRERGLHCRRLGRHSSGLGRCVLQAQAALDRGDRPEGLRVRVVPVVHVDHHQLAVLDRLQLQGACGSRETRPGAEQNVCARALGRPRYDE
mmetsp:Transcript_35077/g.101376  ORF Transcript_35077/g.101376 Transcript_35077/m.101376 type:complete len:365 (+) Transcript_35077:814-1908(+)